MDQQSVRSNKADSVDSLISYVIKTQQVRWVNCKFRRKGKNGCGYCLGYRGVVYSLTIRNEIVPISVWFFYVKK